MLAVKIGDEVYFLPSEHIQQIDYPADLTLLPFACPTIAGLTQRDGTPLLQINLHALLGVQSRANHGGKRLQVTLPQGTFALCVDEVLDFVKTVTPSAQQLQLNEIIPRSLNTLKHRKSDFLDKKQPVEEKSSQKITALLVASAGKTIALFTHNLDRIQETADLHTLQDEKMQTEQQVKIQNLLLPSYSLAHLSGLETHDVCESFAVIVRSTPRWALLVEKVIGLETFSQVYASDNVTNGLWYMTASGQVRELIEVNTLKQNQKTVCAPRLWYVTQEGHLQELLDVQQLHGNSDMPAITISKPPQTTAALQVCEYTSIEGLEIHCGTGCYFLPLSAATRTFKDFAPVSIMPSRKTVAEPANAVPWINANTWLFGADTKNIDHTILITLAQHQFLVGVDKSVLSYTHEKWQTPPLPYPTCLLFDAAYYAVQQKKWVLRVDTTLKFAHLPWFIKKAFVKAILGWLDKKYLTDTHAVY